ncbi:hypothetical protein K2Z84_15420 [Candidatus Binatia bacterium]|nr:hypothetical protein [Candidatus Binatia bacterium]
MDVDAGDDLGPPRRRSPAVALILMSAAPFERRVGGARLPATTHARRDPPPGERTVTLRRGGFGQLGDHVSLDDVV